jgi:outer membrane biosynthesis protein TonB
VTTLLAKQQELQTINEELVLDAIIVVLLISALVLIGVRPADKLLNATAIVIGLAAIIMMVTMYYLVQEKLTLLRTPYLVVNKAPTAPTNTKKPKKVAKKPKKVAKKPKKVAKKPKKVAKKPKKVAKNTAN